MRRGDLLLIVLGVVGVLLLAGVGYGLVCTTGRVNGAVDPVLHAHGRLVGLWSIGLGVPVLVAFLVVALRADQG